MAASLWVVISLCSVPSGLSQSLSPFSQHEATALASDNECGSTDDEGCSLSALQLRRGPGLGSPGKLGSITVSSLPSASASSPPDKQEIEILGIIEKAFSNVRGPGHYVSMDRRVDVSWSRCSEIDWSDNPELRLDKPFGLHGLGTEICRKVKVDKDHDTCKAILATIKATQILAKRFPDGPKFSNAFVLNWGNFSSWTRGSVGPVDWSKTPPTAELKNASGVLGYAICEIIRVITTQSPNQHSSGKCSHMATLDALAHKAPAKAMEMAVRLLWTGRHSPYVEFPCQYIYERQPGLVPWRDSLGNWFPAEAEKHMQGKSTTCTGNEEDCLINAGMPLNTVGLAYMWSQAAISEVDASHHGVCSGRPLANLAYPGMSEERQRQITWDQGGTGSGVLWACHNFIDPLGGSCRVRFNIEACNPGISNPECLAVGHTLFPAAFQDRFDKYISAYEDSLIGKDDLDMNSASFPGREHWDKLWSDMSGQSKELAEELLQAMGRGSITSGLLNYWNYYPISRSLIPSATEELLLEACYSAVAVLLVDSSPLQAFGRLNGYVGQVPFYGLSSSTSDLHASWLKQEPSMARQHGTCDHVVYLEECDHSKNSYRIWSWAMHFTATREMLLGRPVSVAGKHSFNTGMICGSVIADGITWAGRPCADCWQPNKSGPVGSLSLAP